MLTDDQARAVMNEAALGINVAPHAPRIEPPVRCGRLWLAPAGAAAAVALIAAGIVLGARHGHQGVAPVIAPPSQDDLAFRLGPDQVPNVVGLSDVDAARMLRGSGYLVKFQDVSRCAPDGNVVGTEPAVGSVVPSGAEVTIRRVSSASMDCVALSTRLDGGVSDWLIAGGAVANFADHVRVTVDGQSTDLSGPERINSPLWDTVRAQIRGRLTPQLVDDDGRLVFATWDPVLGECVVEGTATAKLCGTPVVAVDDRFVVSRVIVNPAEQVSTPQVVGNSEAFATRRLQALGYRVDTVKVSACAQAGLVIDSRINVDSKIASLSVVNESRCGPPPNVIDSPAEVQVPNVVGLGVGQAARLLTNTGFDHVITNSRSIERCDQSSSAPSTRTAAPCRHLAHGSR